MIQEALLSDMPTIFYESPHRILKTLARLEEINSASEIFIARELTKMHEETLQGTVAEVLAILSKRSSIKGEIVLIVRGFRKA